MKNTASLRVLELGSGSGGLAEQLLGKYQKAVFGELDVEYTLFDIDPEILSWAQGRLLKKNIQVKTRVADDRHLSALEAGEYDLIISLHVLHHIQPIQELEQALQQMQRVGKIGFYCVDLERRRTGLILNKCLTPVIGLDPILVEDGRRSVLRAYTHQEIRAIAPEGIRCQPVRFFPYFVLSQIK